LFGPQFVGHAGFELVHLARLASGASAGLSESFHCLTPFRCGAFIPFRLANSSMFRLNKFATCRASSGV
jgi:hypothetical protein